MTLLQTFQQLVRKIMLYLCANENKSHKQSHVKGVAYLCVSCALWNIFGQSEKKHLRWPTKKHFKMALVQIGPKLSTHAITVSLLFSLRLGVIITL